MNSSLKLKLAGLVILIIMAVITIVPSFYADTPGWWKKYMAPEGLQRGLDLQGGVHLVLKVDLDKAEKDSLVLAARDLKDSLKEKSISAVKTASPAGTIVFTLPNTGAAASVEEMIKNDFPNIAADIEATEGSFPRITLTLQQSQIDFIHKHAVNQSLEIIRNRVDQFGVAEPVIIRQGEDEIVVQLAGIEDHERAKDLIKATAQLEFKRVADASGVDLFALAEETRSTGKWNGEWTNALELEKLNEAIRNRLPQDTKIYLEKDSDPKTGKEVNRPILLDEQILMTGEMVKNAQVRISSQFNEPYVSMDFTGRGGRLFGKITEENVGKRMAIVLDGVVRSAPVIREKILGGAAQISGSFTHEDAADLALVLRVGALPAPVDIIQNMTVGASLGRDSIKKGLTSGIFGAIIVLSFMVIYYRLSGVIANIALVLNILFIFTGLAILNATLTLPGIAGIILSIGMAVDANVLIFERMREEYNLGKTVKSSVNGGFGKAFWTIVDSQVTTLITAMALFMFGTGPIKGFAVTLSLGIIFNLFTALFCSRLLFDTFRSLGMVKKLAYLQFTKNPNLNYMRLRNYTFGGSAVMVAIGLFAFLQVATGNANMGVDF
ncbi:MAG: protein translocase subunit SecD, partial [Thermodesulfobacteriota bacterium]